MQALNLQRVASHSLCVFVAFIFITSLNEAAVAVRHWKSSNRELFDQNMTHRACIQLSNVPCLWNYMSVNHTPPELCLLCLPAYILTL